MHFSLFFWFYLRSLVLPNIQKVIADVVVVYFQNIVPFWVKIDLPSCEKPKSKAKTTAATAAANDKTDTVKHKYEADACKIIALEGTSDKNHISQTLWCYIWLWCENCRWFLSIFVWLRANNTQTNQKQNKMKKKTKRKTVESTLLNRYFFLSRMYAIMESMIHRPDRSIDR